MEQLYYNALSLKNMVIRRIVANIFKEWDILTSIKNFHFKYSFRNSTCLKLWPKIVEVPVVDKIKTRGFPESLKKLVIDTVKPMGRQVLGWKAFHEEYLSNSHHGEEINFDELILGKLCWTEEGEIDYRKTAEELVRSNVIDIEKQYKLACLYCLEDYIRLLWDKLPEEKLKFYSRVFVSNPKQPLQFWWPYIIRGESERLYANELTFHQYVFENSVNKRNKAAAEYFLQKLTEEEKEASLIATTKNLLIYQDFSHEGFPKEKVSETLCYLVSEMTPDQRMRIFRENPCEILKCFLQWPFQDRFSEIADRIWNFLSERSYDSVLWKLYECFRDSSHYFDILFREFFLHIPCDHRKNFLDEQCEDGSCFAHMLKSQERDALEIYFRNVDAATRVGLVCSGRALEQFRSSISQGRWDVVGVCLREARLSIEERERLKETCRGHYMKSEMRKWTSFCQFLDETYALRKRSSEDETSTEANKKKLKCGEEE